MQPPTAKIKQISKNLYLISLTPLIRGFDNFISVWLYKGKNKTFIIDVGPSVTSTSLKIALNFITNPMSLFTDIKTLNNKSPRACQLLST
jgi:hypothetical protein